MYHNTAPSIYDVSTVITDSCSNQSILCGPPKAFPSCTINVLYNVSTVITDSCSNQSILCGPPKNFPSCTINVLYNVSTVIADSCSNQSILCGPPKNFPSQQTDDKCLADRLVINMIFWFCICNHERWKERGRVFGGSSP